MILKKIGIAIVINIMVDILFVGIHNLENGKTLFGGNRKKTVSDWQGNIILGANDYKVEAA